MQIRDMPRKLLCIIRKSTENLRREYFIFVDKDLFANKTYKLFSFKDYENFAQ